MHTKLNAGEERYKGMMSGRSAKIDIVCQKNYRCLHASGLKQYTLEVIGKRYETKEDMKKRKTRVSDLLLRHSLHQQ